ncbi:MAG: M1 family metallopeptidase [bacterium]|nr:M1 family metallopeptidase [bacterium]
MRKPFTVIGLMLACLSACSLASQVRGATNSAPPQPYQAGGEEGKHSHLCAHAAAHANRLERSRQLEAGPREADADTDITHYFLDIAIIPEFSGADATAVKLAGTNTIDANAVSNGLDTFTVDLRSNMTVNAVTGDVSGWSRVGDTIEITLDQSYATGESFQIAVDYEGYPESDGLGAFVWWQRGAGGPLTVATVSDPYATDFWWPCKDALNDKSTVRMHVTVPNGMVAASNGAFEGTEPVSTNGVRYKWNEAYPIVPYLVSLAITDYERYDLVYEYDDGGSPATMPVLCYLYSEHWDGGAGEPLAPYKTGCDELPIILEKLSARYGQYPFIAEKYGVAETGGAGGLPLNMEHQTISSMFRVNSYSNIMTHELAHQWWGDAVACETFYDIWLSEGFATYSESVYREIKPDGGIDSYWQRNNNRRPPDPDSQVYRTSIATAGDIFSDNDVYRKGSWVLHMLRHVLGTEAFFDAVLDYRTAYLHDSATTAEFLASITASFGHDLTWFVDQWVMNPGSPDYEWNYVAENVAGEDYLKLAIWQKQNLGGYDLITMPIDIRVTTGAGATVYTVWNDDWTEHYVLALEGTPTAVEFDEDGGTDDRHWVLFDTLVKVASPVSGPPVLLSAQFTPYANTQSDTTVELAFSEDIGDLDSADLSLTGDVSGAQSPASVVYTGATQTALVTYASLPDDAYTFVVKDDSVLANSQALDGEADDSAWWDDTRLPSGDGQPGGDAVLSFTKQRGDCDANGGLDLADWQSFAGCLQGPIVVLDSACLCADMDLDYDVDAADFSTFQPMLNASLP